MPSSSLENIQNFNKTIFPELSLDSIIGFDYDSAPRLRIRRKLAEFENVKELPKDLADRIAQSAPKKKKNSRIIERNEREKIALGADEDIATSKLIEDAEKINRNNNKLNSNSALIIRPSTGGSSSLPPPSMSTTSLTSFSSTSALANAQPKPNWHAPWKLKRVISGHQGWVRSVCIDPDNRFFATGSADRTIKIWDLASGTLLLSLTGHIMAVRGLVVSPRHPYMFSVGEDKMVKCWDLEQNKVVRQYHGHLSGVYSVDIHPTLDLLVTAGRDAVARVWDIRTRHPVHVLAGHKASISQVRCQEADPQVITTSMDSTVRLWDLAAGKTQTVLTHHKKSVRALTLHPSEFTFATGSPDNIKQWKCPEGSFMHNFYPHQNSIINTLSVNEDGVMFAGGDDGSMGFYDWKSGHKFQQFDTVAIPGSLSAEAGIFASAFDRSGLRLITCEADKSIKIWGEDNDATEETHPLDWKPSFNNYR